MPRPKHAILLLSTFLLTPILAGTVLAEGLSDFQAWQAQTNNEFQSYKDARDKEFVATLADSWREINVLKGKVRDETPKLPDQPVAPDLMPSETPLDDAPAPIILPVVTLPQPPVKPIIKPVMGKLKEVSYFGFVLNFDDKKPLRPAIKLPLTQETVRDAWSNLSQLDYETAVEELVAYGNDLDLADWAKVQLTWQYAASDERRKFNEKVLLTWFLLVKQGFDAKVAFDKNFLYLVMPSDQPIYGAAYFTVEGSQYYWIDLGKKGLKPHRAFTYEGKYPNAERSLDMRFSKTIQASGKDANRQVRFEFDKAQYEINIAYALNRVEYFQTYPQIDLKYYFESSLYPQLGKNIVEQLQPIVSKMNEKQAVDFLLRMVQKGFPYATDANQFGEENYLLPEEMFFYPQSDCEDRSILFAWLVRNVLGLEVVALNYPGHVATAVSFKGKVSGDAYRYQGKAFTVADPTYINARSGMTMSNFKGLTPRIEPVL